MINGIDKYLKKGMTVAVLGIGISNIPLIKILDDCSVKIVVRDKRTKEDLKGIISQFDKTDITYILGENYLDNLNEDVIFKTPGMRYDLPQLVNARKNGSFITSEMELFFELCPAQIIGITGSDGKTTTTTLISEMLKEQGYTVWLGGNIGTPLLSRVNDISADDKVVVELSSFQLHTMKKSPQISVITNISPNHLDMHKDYEEYIDAKKNIMKYQSPSSRLVVNYDNEVTNGIGKEASGKVVYFSRKIKPDNGIYVHDDFICVNGEKVLDVNKIKIPGWHNVENYMAAIGAVWGMADADTINKVAQTFGGVEHRIELVRELDGVKYYNSSIDSSPNRTKNTLNVFNQKVILISGGKDKGIPYDEIGPVIMEKAKTLILTGATADVIEQAVIKASGGKDMPEIIRCTSYDEIVKTAKNKAQPGDIVVLSPASTSFDMFRNFEERGKLFKKLVNEL